MARKIVPIATRRLTKAEAAKLGVKYSAKRQVPVSLKRVTIKTKTYSENEVRAARYGMTKEKRTLIKKIEHRDFTVAPDASWFRGLPEQSMKHLRQMAAAESVDDWYKVVNQWLREKLEKTDLRAKIPDRDFRHLTYRRITELQKRKRKGKSLNAWQQDLLDWLDEEPDRNPFFYH